jgi:hypothetical protein
VARDVARPVGDRWHQPAVAVARERARREPARQSLRAGVAVVHRQRNPAPHGGHRPRPGLVPGATHLRPVADRGGVCVGVTSRRQWPPPRQPPQVLIAGRTREGLRPGGRVHQDGSRSVLGGDHNVHRHVVKPFVGHHEPDDPGRAVLRPGDVGRQAHGARGQLNPGQTYAPVQFGARHGLAEPKQQLPAPGADVDHVEGVGMPERGINGADQPEQRRGVERRRVHRGAKVRHGTGAGAAVEAPRPVQRLGRRGAPTDHPGHAATLPRMLTGRGAGTWLSATRSVGA